MEVGRLPASQTEALHSGGTQRHSPPPTVSLWAVNTHLGSGTISHTRHCFYQVTPRVRLHVAHPRSLSMMLACSRVLTNNPSIFLYQQPIQHGSHSKPDWLRL